MKTIFIPSTLNPPTTPPENSNPVFVKFSDGDYVIIAYEEGEWVDTLNRDPYFLDKEDALDVIEGWAYIVQH